MCELAFVRKVTNVGENRSISGVADEGQKDESPPLSI